MLTLKQFIDLQFTLYGKQEHYQKMKKVKNFQMYVSMKFGNLYMTYDKYEKIQELKIFITNLIDDYDFLEEYQEILEKELYYINRFMFFYKHRPEFSLYNMHQLDEEKFHSLEEFEKKHNN